MYNAVHTSFDVMKEFLITGCELDGKYQIPVVPPCNLDYLPEDSVDFEDSFRRNLKNHRKLNVNFYIDDSKFMRFWNNPDVEEIKSWDIEQKEEAVAELSKLRCKYLELAEIYEITEYALEYFVADEDGEFISGSDFDFAEDK